jgi:hypothetical protein
MPHRYLYDQIEGSWPFNDTVLMRSLSVLSASRILHDDLSVVPPAVQANGKIVERTLMSFLPVFFYEMNVRFKPIFHQCRHVKHGNVT